MGYLDRDDENYIPNYDWFSDDGLDEKERKFRRDIKFLIFGFIVLGVSFIFVAISDIDRQGIFYALWCVFTSVAYISNTATNMLIAKVGSRYTAKIAKILFVVIILSFLLGVYLLLIAFSRNYGVTYLYLTNIVQRIYEGYRVINLLKDISNLAEPKQPRYD